MSFCLCGVCIKLEVVGWMRSAVSVSFSGCIHYRLVHRVYLKVCVERNRIVVRRTVNCDGGE